MQNDFSVPIDRHTSISLRNLINLIYSRGPLLGKATGGYFGVDKGLVEKLKEDACVFTKANFFKTLSEYELEYGASMYGVEFASKEIRFTGFGGDQDAEHQAAYAQLVHLMSEHALKQTRIQAQTVDITNEKYVMRTWLMRLGMNGSEYKAARRILTENLSNRQISAASEKEKAAHGKYGAKQCSTAKRQESAGVAKQQESAGAAKRQKAAGAESGGTGAGAQQAFLSAESIRRAKRQDGKQRVAAYIRVSTDAEDQENSYETQEQYFCRLLEQNIEWVSAGVYSDYGITGTSNKKRVGFKRILRHCREGKIDRIICKSVSRFARNTTDFITALSILDESNVTILFEKEGLDTANPTSSFILTTLAAIAQEESRSVSANVRWGNEKRFQRGDVRNQDIYGYRYTKEIVTTESGYCYRAVEIVPEEAEVVRWIFGQVAEGATYKAVARELNRRHVLRRQSDYTRKRMENARKGQLRSDVDEGWTYAQIGSIIKNERYTGDVLVQKTYTEDYLTHRSKMNTGEMTRYLVKNHHPAIISRELFEETRKIRKMNAGRAAKGTRTPRAFSGRIICGCCGRFYNVRNARNHPIWFCPSTVQCNGKNICSNEKVYEEQIVRVFRKAVCEMFCLFAAPVFNCMDEKEVLNGCYVEGPILSDFAVSFVGVMLAKLENVQRMDFMERDRASIKRQILAANAEEKEKLSARLEYLEEYWEELEKDHGHRDAAIKWMKSLPKGRTGTVEFLNGMTDFYAKAFVLSVIVSDPFHYTIHWFDDTYTDVEMHSNIGDYRNKTDCFDAKRGVSG